VDGMNYLEGKIIIVTGGTSGLGKSLVLQLINLGAKVNILSTCCLFSNEGLGSYTASKGALDSLTKVLRKEARKDNIRVCSVYPGGINTSFRPQAREEYLSADIAAETIINSINIDERVALDEIVLRPFIETNYR